jgi:glucose dehydrogenase
VAGDVVIVGAAFETGANPRSMVNVKGYVRAFDARTGKRLWAFHTIPQPDEFGYSTWLGDSADYTGNTGVWAQISIDQELGLAYLPVEMPTHDYYGGKRPGNNLFSESIVAVELRTGKRRWHYQLVHHGLWDMDIPCPPILVDITVNGKPVKALAQPTKQAFLYVFNRETGEPIWPIEERPVPASDVPGERASPTQPVPTRPAPFEQQGVTADDLADFTPEIKATALEAVKPFRLGPLYTPPSLQGTLVRPSAVGGGNWSGAAVDPETGLLYVPSRNGFGVSRLARPEPDAKSNLLYMQAPARSPQMPDGLPLLKPPYSRLTAIDMNRGEQVWMTPAGNGNRIRQHPRLKGLNLPPLGGDSTFSGPLLTKTLLIYALTAGGSHDGPRLVAYDKATGKELASTDLPGAAIGTPMTYLLDGKQYIALTVQGATPRDIPEVVALALP